MKISRASTYAIYGLSYLAGQPQGRMVPLSELRAEWSLPEKHLAKIFQLLVRSGHLKAVRGVHGGFALARPAASISALEIIRVVDGHAAPEHCPRHAEPQLGHPCCMVTHALSDSRTKVEAVLRAIRLSDLVTPAGRRALPPGHT